MIDVKDRIPTMPNRMKLTEEADGTVHYVVLERADEAAEAGTPINKALFDSIQEDLENQSKATGVRFDNVASNMKATDVQGAIEEILANNGSTIVEVSLPIASWGGAAAPFSQNITVLGYNPNTMIAQPSPKNKADKDEWAKCGLWFADTGGTTITVYAYDGKPANPISVIMEVRDKK